MSYQRLRLASVAYVNAEPLTRGFEKGPFRDPFEVRRVPPAAIPALLRSGEADIGLIPSIEYQRMEGLEILPHLCIGSKRRARSVYLASRTPLESIRSVALDRNSRTSAALARIVLAHRGIREVAWGECAPSLEEMLQDHDAALLIGDAALQADTRGLLVTDLAAAWHAMTGLPFVFAVWAVRAGTPLPEGLRPFLESRRIGLAAIPQIAREAAARLRLEAGVIEEYLRVNIHYHLGTEETRALHLFYRQAVELGLLAGLRPVRMFDAVEREPVHVAGEEGA
jgi:chorismate dehydratase